MMAKKQGNGEPASPTLRNRANEAHGTARERAVETYGSARERAIEAYDSARERASDARARAGKGIDELPLLALGGGMALGALIGALLPKTKTEERMLGGVGGRLTDAARSASAAAKEAGREKLAELNITQEAGKGAIQNLIDGITEAARSSGQAAIGAVRNKG